MTKLLDRESRGKFKTAPRLKIRRGSLKIVKTNYGAWLYGSRTVNVTTDDPPVMLGYIMISDVAGMTHRLDPYYDPNEDAVALTKDYNFKLID